MKNKKAVCTLSGGLDSAVCASIAKSKGYSLYFLFFRYGQKTQKKEEECVRKLTRVFNPEQLLIIDLPWIKELGNSGLFDKRVKLSEKNFIREYVPFRNSVFWSVATAWGETLGAERIFIGSSGGDRICPDNSMNYISAFQKVMRLGTLLKKDILLSAPLAKADKIKAVKVGLKLGTPFEFTWSCLNNSDTACGHCSNCRERLKAFELNKVEDLIVYKQ